MIYLIATIAAVVVILLLVAAFRSDAQDKYKEEVARELFSDAKPDGECIAFHCHGFRMSLGVWRELRKVRVTGHRNAFDNDFNNGGMRVSISLGRQHEDEVEVRKDPALVIRHPGASCYEFQIRHAQPPFHSGAVEIGKILSNLTFRPADNLIRNELLDDDLVRQSFSELSALGSFEILCNSGEIVFSIAGPPLSSKEEMASFVRASIRFFQGMGKIFARESDSWVEKGLGTSVDWDSPYFVPDADHPARAPLSTQGLSEEGIWNMDDAEAAGEAPGAGQNFSPLEPLSSEKGGSVPSLTSGSPLDAPSGADQDDGDCWTYRRGS